nr:hypothetical protein BaRGS_018424 [Batillaria attramentaria]
MYFFGLAPVLYSKTALTGNLHTADAEGTLQHHQAGARVEPAGEEEERAPQADLEEELALRAARLRPDMGGGQDLRQGQSEMEESC